MLKKYGPFWGALLVLAALFIFVENAVAPNFQSCVSQHSTSQGDEKTQQKGRVVLKTVLAESVCTLQLIDRHNGFFAAVAAFVIAGFTFTLWRSTEKLWRASEDQLDHAKNEAMSAALRRLKDEVRLGEQIEIARQTADAATLNAQALIDSERAHLHAVIKNTNLHDALRAAIWYTNSPGMDDGHISNRPAVEFCLKNLGKTPAILREVSYQIIQGDVFQKVFDYKIGAIAEPIVDGGAETAPPTDCGLETLFTVGDSRRALDGKRPLFFYGYIIFETAFGRQYEYRWRYVNGGIRWLLDHYEEFEKGGQPKG